MVIAGVMFFLHSLLLLPVIRTFLSRVAWYMICQLVFHFSDRLIVKHVLLSIAYAYEQASKNRVPPKFKKGIFAVSHILLL
jgi:membrane protein required for beta-lactamase induction